MIRKQFKRSTLAIMLVTFFSIGLAINEAKASLPESPNADDWNMFQHDPSHTGRTSATIDNTSPLFAQWAYPFGERVDIQVQPVIENGVMFVGSQSGEMHAISADTGQSIWIVRPGGPILHTAAVDNNRVFFGSVDGKIYSLDASNGAIIWSYQTDGPIISAPSIVDNKVFIGSNDGNLYAFDASTGNKLWHFETNGPVISSPAVKNGKVYFGSEDMFARSIDTNNGKLLWRTKLFGFSMRNTFPIISENGEVVIFFTVKPGVDSYVPVEDYPYANTNANPITTWNTYYQKHPSYRTLYYLDAASGTDLWNPSSLRYVPLPIPYWGLLYPILHPDGSAWFPAPAGTSNYAPGNLDHDNRLFRVDLSTGISEQIAGGSFPEFQLRPDEVGRHIFSGEDYYYTISEDLGVFKPASGETRVLFSNGDPSGFNFGSHMDPHSPLPTRHLWRYGGAIAMGGVPGASPPIVVENKIFFISYGWLYAFGTQDKNQNLADDISPDRRQHILTYPRTNIPSISEIQNEIENRVANIIIRGVNNPPITARWDQAGSTNLLYNEFSFEVYGFDADLVRVLSEAYPLLPSDQKGQLATYLAQYVDNTLLNQASYQAGTVNCIIFGIEGIYTGRDNCDQYQYEFISATWRTDNPNLTAMRFYALWAYADATNDWTRITNNWDFIRSTFDSTFIESDFCKPHPQMHFCAFEEWRVGRLNIGAQIGVAQAIRDMATYIGDTQTAQNAQNFLLDLLDGRLLMANFVPNLYQQGIIEPAQIRLNREAGGDPNDYRIHNPDIMGPDTPYNYHLIPYRAELRDGTNDPSQLNWWYSDSNYQVDEGIGYMYYPGLSGYFPMSESLADLMYDNLYQKTVNYVNSYEVNQPWWWLTDLASSTTCSGEHLYHSPTLSWSLFQTKAHVLREDWSTLARQLPEPVSFNTRYDLFRLQNLVTLANHPDAPQEPNIHSSSIAVNDPAPQTGESTHITIKIQNSGAAMTTAASLNTTVPAGLAYVASSLKSTCGTHNDNQTPLLQWSGILDSNTQCTVEFDALVTETDVTPIQILASISIPDPLLQHNLSIIIIANGYTTSLPVITR